MKKALILAVAVSAIGSAALAGGKPSSVPGADLPEAASGGMDASADGRAKAADALAKN